MSHVTNTQKLAVSVEERERVKGVSLRATGMFECVLMRVYVYVGMCVCKRERMKGVLLHATGMFVCV